MIVVNAQAAPTSIYAHLAETKPASQATRRSRRARAEARVVTLDGPWPPVRLDREPAIRRAVQTAADLGLDAFCEELTDEVTALETWAAQRSTAAQTCGVTVRRTLELLKRFGRLSAMDFSDVPVEDRPTLIKILALEHRWCYAAAGTTRDAFKQATGRTGAR